MNSGNKPKNNVTYLRKLQPAILVVEHQILTRTAIAESLREWGFKVYEAGTGEEAATLLRSGTIDVAFALIDLDMTGEMKGIDLIGLVREDFSGIVALVASTNRKKASIADDLGLHFIQKPYDPEQIVVIIRRASPRRR